MQKLISIFVAFAAASLSGCAVVTTAASVTGSVVSTTVDVTGHVVSGAADAVSSSGSDRKDDKD